MNFLLFSFSLKANDKDIEACLSLYQITASAIDYKNKGKTKEEMLKPLPPKEHLQKFANVKNGKVLIGLAMYDVIDEIYDYEVLPISVYAPFASEKCVRRANKLPIIPYSQAFPLLKKCSLLNDSKEQLECAFKVVNSKNT